MYWTHAWQNLAIAMIRLAIVDLTLAAGRLYVLLLVLTPGWGTLRTILFFTIRSPAFPKCGQPASVYRIWKHAGQALKRFASFLEIDPVLISAASEQSPDLVPQAEVDISSLIARPPSPAGV